MTSLSKGGSKLNDEAGKSQQVFTRLKPGFSNGKTVWFLQY